jgi:hypothetical protein
LGWEREGAGITATPYGKFSWVAKWALNELFEVVTFADLNNFFIIDPIDRKFNELWRLFCSL